MATERTTDGARTTGAPAPVVRSWWRIGFGTLLILAGAFGLLLPFLSWSLSADTDVLIGTHESVGAGSAGAEAEEEGSGDRILIPSLRISMPISSSPSSEQGLSRGAWLWPDAVRPGQVGNAVIFGHRFRYLPPLSNTFFRLDKAAVGDELTIRYGGEELRYRVTSSRITTPEDLSVIASSSAEVLTLVTCHPVWSTSERLVVTAERILLP